MIERIQKEGYWLYRPVVDPVKSKSETAEQTDFVAWLRLNYPWYAEMMFHVPNEGDRSAQYRIHLHKMGELKGVSDLIILRHNGMALEMKKAQLDARTSKEQKKFLTEAALESIFACVCHGAEAAKVAFLEWVRENSE